MMNAVSSATSGLFPRAIAASRHERIFHSSMAIAMTLTTFAGFAPSFYLKAHFATPPPLTPLLYVHGFAMSAWMALLVVQTSLIAAHRADIHKRLGVAGSALAVVLMILGGALALSRAKQGVLGAGTGMPPLMLLVIPVTTLVVFPVLFGAAIWFRERPDIHKRLVLIATLEFVTAAVARLPVISTAGPLAFFSAADVFVLAIVVRDFVTLKRLHGATLGGGLFLIGSQAARMMVAGTAAWLVIAKWLTS